MNKKEEIRFEKDLGELLEEAGGGHDGFVCDLNKVFDLRNYNISRRRVSELVSDMLTGTSFCDQYGHWVVAEVEGTIVQFTKITNNAVWLEDGKRQLGQRKWDKL